jgi:hypothetical protein
MMLGCSECKTTFTAVVGGHKVCYYCGKGTGEFYPDPVIAEIPLGEDLGTPIVADTISIISDDHSSDTYVIDYDNIDYDN